MSARPRQRPRRRRGLLAASFLATFAALPACQETTGGPQFAPNPPAPNPPSPPTATATDPAPTPDPQPTASTKQSPPVLNPPAPSASSTAELPPAPNGGRIERQPDGSCMWYADVHCPKPPATCNPPAPHKVKCP